MTDLRLGLVAAVLVALLAILGLGCQATTSSAAELSLPTTPLLRQAEPAVFAHVMVSYRTPMVSGEWRGWNHQNKLVQRRPDTLNAAGRPDLAATYYPAIGPYDMTDPRVADYHCQLAVMAGIDGFMFDLGFFQHPVTQTEHWTVTAMRHYRDAMQRYGLKAVLVYEDKYHWLYDKTVTTRADAVTASFADIEAWLDFFAPIQYRVDQRPLLALFSYGGPTPNLGVRRLRAQELADWLDQQPAADRPIVVTQWLRQEMIGVLNGRFEWAHLDRAPVDSAYRKIGSTTITRESLARKRGHARDALAGGDMDFYIPSAWPGFDDEAVMGWGEGRRVAPREDGEQYRLTWDAALASGLPTVQVSTWNDWFEGSNIEPAVEFGDRYLEMTRQYSARWHDREPAAADFRLPEWIYKVRLSSTDPAALTAMDRASEAIRVGDLQQARELVQPWADQLLDDDQAWWRPPAAVHPAADAAATDTGATP